MAGPEGEDFTADLQREYLTLPAVMITGSRNHRVVEMAGPAGSTGWAVLHHTACRQPAASTTGLAQAWIDERLSGILRAAS
ncbi:hypothetical protein AB0953_29485 [Streptomyces sp. NPDC046866]|uniref:hypothetical protein n=1 Tax=Streptomyces sp. NPDC046866 TaxID=3154921 RepID=UPI003453951F